LVIPLDVFWGGVIAVVGFIFGTLWGHHAAIGKRVTYAECSRNRDGCACVSELKELQKLVDTMHPHKKN
jgi:hypothetical protein